ncbi:MFS general substrate transporter [Apiospora arundinis]
MVDQPAAPERHGLFHGVDGGLRGWCAVLGSWLFQFSMIGTLTAFGSYQTFYQSAWLPAYSESTIAWVGSTQLFLEFFLGVVGGFLLDGGRWRLAVGGGSVLFAFSFFMLSLCKQGQYAPVFLSQGVGMGVGLGFAFLPLHGIIAKHFTRRRSLAMGIITTGTSLGGFAFSVLASKLFSTRLGFAWTVRVCEFITLGCILLGNVLMSEPKEKKMEKAQVEEKLPVTPADSSATAATTMVSSETQKGSPNSTERAATAGDLHESSGSDVEAVTSSTDEKPRTIPQLLRDPAYLAIISSGFIAGLGLYFPMFAIQSFALEHGISPGIADWLLSIMNLSGVLGRTIPNWMADRYGTLELYVPCTAAAGGLVIALGAATSPGSIVVVSILYGFFAGSIVSLYFPTVCALDPHVTSTGARLGIACLPVGLAALVGTPIAEALVGEGGQWWRGVGFAGATELASAVLLAFAWAVERRRKGK